MTRGMVLAVLVAGVSWFAAGSAHAAPGFLRCESISYRHQYCNANTQGRVIMVREISTGNLCREGRGWGFDNNGIWVDRGCRAEFSYGRDDGGGGHWGRAGTMICESIGYRYRYCNADTQGRVGLARELSTGNLCRQGSGWGYDNGGIWVDRGCRGEFRYGRDSGGRNDAAIAAGVLGALAIAAVASSQSTPQAAPPPAAPAPPPPAAVQAPPGWAVGSYQAYDPDSGDIVQLVVGGGGRVYLRNEVGAVVSEGDLRDGMVHWVNGKRSWFAREGPGILVGDVDTGRHFYFRRTT